MDQNRKMRLTGRDRDEASARRRTVGRWIGAALPVLLALVAFDTPAARGDPSPTRIVPIALSGNDPVSYFLPEGPRPGSPRFEADWDGRVFRFATEANLAVFWRDPGVYAPRLGGFDAEAVLDGRLADADPKVFALVEGRLYLFRDAARRARFLADPALARKAEEIWPTLGRLLDDPDEFAGAKPAAPAPRSGEP